MTDIQKQIVNIQKQNDGMETGFKNKGIKFTKLSIDNMEPEKTLMILKDYNEYLKNISKNNKPPPQQKEAKPIIEQSVKEKKVNKNDSDDEDELTKEEKITFPTIYNMEDVKRAFFSKEYDTFNNLIQEQPLLKFYKATYKWADDNTGKADFAARNLLRGFVQGLDSYRKYLMVCFRCILVDIETKKYTYPSYWIVNTEIDMNKLLGSLYDDYDFIKIDDSETISKILKKMEKNEDENDTSLIGEVYLH